MSQEEAELLTEDEEEDLVSAAEDEYEEELEDEIEEGEGEEEAEEGAYPSPDGEEDMSELVEEVEGAAGGAARSGKGRGFPNPLALLGQLRPRNLAKAVKARKQGLQRLVWRIEDASVGGAKFARKFLLKAARPALVWLIVSRAVHTIDAARDPRIRMLRQPEHKQMDYYYSRLLGKNWRQQLDQDLLEAVREVDAGYITDDVVREKRKLAAVMLRRMEVEEWDKERMRHFYYGLYGMGPWYWDMEERLHNPFFTGARGWNGPIEGWVGENQTFGRDVAAADVDFREAALDAIGAARGRPVRGAARAAALEREALRGADAVLGGRLFEGVVDRAAARAAVVGGGGAAAVAAV
ncbi:MAG: hypothetical protein J3K34DRAFT_385002 [Monoraphidium minutum]|nr:MAG: hypothetical protein J3K34DRAFT_385002 [Monoraphidium minutum]